MPRQEKVRVKKLNCCLDVPPGFFRRVGMLNTKFTLCFN